MEMSIDAAIGQVTVHYTNDKGEQKVESERMTLPPDLANGLILVLLKNTSRSNMPPGWPYIVATPKPRLVKVALSAPSADRFGFGQTHHDVTHFVLKMELGGMAGLIAPLIGKQPADGHVWMLDGDAPAFVRAEQQFYRDGPVWRIDLVAPVWAPKR
jgi:hypothetical protein